MQLRLPLLLLLGLVVGLDADRRFGYHFYNDKLIWGSYYLTISRCDNESEMLIYDRNFTLWLAVLTPTDIVETASVNLSLSYFEASGDCRTLSVVNATSGSNVLNVYEMNTATNRYELLAWVQNQTNLSVLSPDGTLLAAVGVDGVVTLYKRGPINYAQMATVVLPTDALVHSGVFVSNNTLLLLFVRQGDIVSMLEYTMSNEGLQYQGVLALGNNSDLPSTRRRSWRVSRDGSVLAISIIVGSTNKVDVYLRRNSSYSLILSVPNRFGQSSLSILPDLSEDGRYLTLFYSNYSVGRHIGIDVYERTGEKLSLISSYGEYNVYGRIFSGFATKGGTEIVAQVWYWHVLRFKPCSAGQYPSGGQCLTCNDTNCDVCENSTTCLRCIDTFDLSMGVCTQVPPPPPPPPLPVPPLPAPPLPPLAPPAPEIDNTPLIVVGAAMGVLVFGLPVLWAIILNTQQPDIRIHQQTATTTPEKSQDQLSYSSLCESHLSQSQLNQYVD